MLKIVVAVCLLVAIVQGAIISVGPDGDRVFSPLNITIKVNSTLVWKWDSGTHNVVSGTICTPDGVFTSGSPTAGATFNWTFNQTGTFPYYCDNHCLLGMVGTVFVTEDGSTAGGESTTTTTSSAVTFVPGALLLLYVALATLLQ